MSMAEQIFGGMMGVRSDQVDKTDKKRPFDPTNLQPVNRPAEAASDAGAVDRSGEPATTELPESLRNLPSVIVVCGHYGVGKTNLSMNMALDLVAEGKDVCLVDMDVVNPYFRSSDYPHVLEEAGVDLLAPEFSQSALDAPMLSGRIGTEIGLARKHENRVLIIDVGGDDVGATALGSYSALMNAGDYAMLYVVNAFREQTVDPAEAARVLPEIEAQARVKATAIVNNSHLQGETQVADVERGVAYARDVAHMVDLPLLASAVPLNLKDSVNSDVFADHDTYFVRRLVTTPWDV